MTLKVILAFIDAGLTSDGTLETALLVAEQFGARLDVLYVPPDPATMVSLVAGGIPGAAISDPAAEMVAKSVDERTRRARAAFDRLAAKAGAIATWRQETGIEPVVLAGAARLSDLTVIGQPNTTSDGRLRASLDSVIFDTGRPVLVVPVNPRPTVGRSIAIAWNGSPKASLAVAASLPFLEKAETITVLNAPVGKQGSPGEALAAYLSKHGIKASVKSVDPQGKSTGKAMLEYVQRQGVDLLVMGAWGHSRIREMILGGTTREVLTQMTLPVLMAH